MRQERHLFEQWQRYKTFVHEARRIKGKSVQTYLGNYNEPRLRVLYRTARLQIAVRKRTQLEIRRTKHNDKALEPILDILDEFVASLPVLRLLLERSGFPMTQSKKQSQSKFWAEAEDLFRSYVKKQTANYQAANHQAGNSAQNQPQTTGKPFSPAHLQWLISFLPARKDFRRLSKAADQGDKMAAKKLDEACSASKKLMESFSDFVSMAKWMVAKQFSQGNMMQVKSIQAKAEQQEADLAKRAGDDPLLKMHAEIVVVAYIDAMRCALLAAHQYDFKTEAEHFQRLADRSAKRFTKISGDFAKLAKKHGQASSPKP
jgi:hypothetical protein